MSRASGTIPRGVEVLVKKAAVDAAFREALLSRRAAAADEIRLALAPAEAAMLNAVPRQQLEAIIDATVVEPRMRAAFSSRSAVLMLAALGMAVGVVSIVTPSLGQRIDRGQGADPRDGATPATSATRPGEPLSRGIRPDRPATTQSAGQAAELLRQALGDAPATTRSLLMLVDVSASMKLADSAGGDGRFEGLGQVLRKPDGEAVMVVLSDGQPNEQSGAALERAQPPILSFSSSVHPVFPGVDGKDLLSQALGPAEFERQPPMIAGAVAAPERRPAPLPALRLGSDDAVANRALVATMQGLPRPDEPPARKVAIDIAIPEVPPADNVWSDFEPGAPSSARLLLPHLTFVPERGLVDRDLVYEMLLPRRIIAAPVINTTPIPGSAYEQILREGQVNQPEDTAVPQWPEIRPQEKVWILAGTRPPGDEDW